MRWLLVCLSLGTAVAAIELHCAHPLCEEQISDYRRKFTVEGHNVEFDYKSIKNEEISEKFYLGCDGWQALDSPAMPRFAAEYRSWSVDLSNCPLPTRNISIAAALAALNVTLQPVKHKLYLELPEFPRSELLTANHFVGLEHLTYLKIYRNYEIDPPQQPTPEAGFLAGLQTLGSLHLVGVRLPAGELYRLPKSLKRLWLCGESLNSLPGTLPAIMSETVRALPGLKHLMLDQYQFTAPEFNDSAKNDTTPQLNVTYSLESLELMSWKELRLVPLEQCDVLNSLAIHGLISTELPDRWLAACPHLETVMVESAHQLTSLPAKVLEGATALKRLTIRLTKIRSLPDGFLKGAPNLRKLDLSSNWLRSLPSGVFLGPALQSLSLERNKLRMNWLTAIAPLTSLTELKLGSNEFNNICQDDGYSSLRNLTRLKTLSLSETHVSQICRDWRENFIYLEKLKLVGTDFTGLKFTDYLFTRDATVKNAEVTLSTSIYQVNFTRANYESALAAPGPGVTFKFASNWRYPNRQIYCDCSAYWLRRAVDSASHVIRLEGLTCKNGRDFKQMTPEEMCPENALNTA